MTKQLGLLFNYGIKVDDSADFWWPLIVTMQMKNTFTSNITSKYVAWFMWGSIINGLSVIGALMGCVAVLVKGVRFIKAMTGLIAFLQCIGGLAWLVTG